MTGHLSITFLGTGSAIPPKERFQVSTALRHDHGLILFDCGEGTQYQLRKFGVSLRKEIVICISHLHPDHFLGLPGLLASLLLLEYRGKVVIIGPKHIEQVVNNLLAANLIRIDQPPEIHEISETNPFDGNNYTISCVKAIHKANAVSYIWKEKERPGKIDEAKLKELGIPFGPDVGKLQSGESIFVNDKEIFPSDVMGEKTRGRVIAYSGDTYPNEKLANYINSACDILIHEATYPSDMIDLAKKRNHSTFTQAAELAKKANAKKLYLTHISPRITELEFELNLAKQIFKNTELAYDGLKIKF